MYKIGISGKANSGKNTVAKLINKSLCNAFYGKRISCANIAFADPIKSIIKIMFPGIPRKQLYGSSEYRALPIPGAFKNGAPLTVRQLLLDLGTEVGRGYKESIWLDTFDNAFNKANHKSIVIVADVRFKNEFDHLKKLGFYQIRLIRNSHSKINHISETNQDTISDGEFNFVLNNNGTIGSLKDEVAKIVKILIS